MNFVLDLLDSVADEAPSAVLEIVRDAAQAGRHLVVQRWVEEQLDRDPTGASLGSDKPLVSEAMMAMATFADGPAGAPQAAKTFAHWVDQAHAGSPERPQVISGMLTQCVLSNMPSRESAGRELLTIGANPLALARTEAQDQAFDLAGVKVGLQERNATLVAHALSWQHPLAGDLVEKSSGGKNPWPIVAEVGVNGAFHPVNAAGYCLAIGDMKMLREVCKRTRGDEHHISMGLSHAIDFALTSGLAERCTPEVAQGIALCAANGADLDHARIGQRLTTQRIQLAEEVSGHENVGSPNYLLPALFISASSWREALTSISSLVNDYGMTINGPVTEDGHQASLLHYAAASGRRDLVSGLVKLGADSAALDSRGLSPLKWAQIFGRQQAIAFLDPDAAQQEVSEAPAPKAGKAPKPGSKAAAYAAAFDPAMPQEPADMAGWSPDSAEWNPSDEPWIADESDMSAEHAAEAIAAAEASVGIEPKASKAETAAAAKAAKVAEREQVATSMSAAQASRGAALFNRLRSAQAEISAEAINLRGEPDNEPVTWKKPEAGALAAQRPPAPAPATAPARRPF